MYIPKMSSLTTGSLMTNNLPIYRVATYILASKPNRNFLALGAIHIGYLQSFIVTIVGNPY